MSPVTRLAQLLRPIFFSIRMENFTWVARDEIQETKQKWWNINLHLSYNYHTCSLVNSCNFTNKVNSHTSEVEKHIQHNYYAILAIMLQM